MAKNLILVKKTGCNMNLIRLFLFLAFVFLSPQIKAEESFLKTSDIPLMPDLKINATEQMDFDTPTGQVLVLEGKSKNKTGDEIILFYENILPQMGWRKIEKGLFKRNGDTLNIMILKNKKPAKVQFDISLTGGH